MTENRQYEEQSDEVLARWSQEGDEEAFGELVRRHSSKVYAKAFQLLRDEQEALEASQEAWVKAWQKLDQFRGDANFTTWITRVVINLCFDRIRRYKRTSRWAHDSIEEMNEAGKPWERHLPTEDPDPLAGLEREEQRRQNDEALAKLSEVQRLAIILHDLEGLEYREVARIMQCSVGTVMSRLFYGRRKLAALLEDVRKERLEQQGRKDSASKESKEEENETLQT